MDDLAAMEKIRDFIEMLPGKQKNTKGRLHKGARPIFNQYNVEDQIESIVYGELFADGLDTGEQFPVLG